MNEREILAAAFRWHAANIKRLEASSENSRYMRASKAAINFGSSHPTLSRRVTEAKRIELAALRALAKACVKSLQVETIDVAATEPPTLSLTAGMHCHD